MPVKITIDANLINARGKLPAMNALEKWQAEGKLQLVGAQRLEDEIASHPLQPEANAKVARMENISEPAVWGISKWGKATWASAGKVSYKELASILFPAVDLEKLSDNQKNDVMHLLGHAYSDSEIFITDNTKDFIANGRQETLLSGFKILVMTASNAITFLSERHGWKPS